MDNVNFQGGMAAAYVATEERAGIPRGKMGMLAAAPDANDYRIAGDWCFYCPTVTIVPDAEKPNTVINNWPKFGTANAASLLTVEINLKVLRRNSNTYCTQICWRKAKNEVWIRSLSTADTWSDWKKVSDQLCTVILQNAGEVITQKALADALNRKQAA